MAIYDAAVALETTLASTVDVCQVTAQDKQDQRPGKNCNTCLNITPTGTDRRNETGGSFIADYKFKLSLWVFKPVRSNAKSMLQLASNTWDSVLTALQTGALGGYARMSIPPGEVNDTWESGDDGDIAYTVRADIIVQKQEVLT